MPGSSSPGVIVANTHSVGASLAVWLAAGLLAWTGASSFAELGYVTFIPVTFTLDSVILRSSIPLDGGPQAYLLYAYGPLVSYLFSWTAISALKPGLCETQSPCHSRILIFSSLNFAGSSATISLIFAEYINRLIRGEVSPDSIPQWSIKLTAIIAVLLVALICSATKKMGTRASVLFTFLKVGGYLNGGTVSLIDGPCDRFVCWYVRFSFLCKGCETGQPGL